MQFASVTIHVSKETKSSAFVAYGHASISLDIGPGSLVTLASENPESLHNVLTAALLNLEQAVADAREREANERDAASRTSEAPEVIDLTGSGELFRQLGREAAAAIDRELRK